FLPMEACVNPATRRLLPENLEASPVRAGSSHETEYVLRTKKLLQSDEEKVKIRAVG
ncbi:hypothetical protein DEU29_1241, partial [Idiomarina aquatica]